jgi:hypothetical protein
LTRIQDKLAQVLSCKFSWIFSQISKQITQMETVIVECGIAGATLLAHPGAERNQQVRIRNNLLSNSGRDEIRGPGIAEKQTRTLPEVPPVCVAVSWASASVQVLGKLLDRLFVQSSHGSAFPANPINQVLGGSNVPSSCYLCIARLTQLLSKALKQVATWAAM